jgi:hypothetical protein
MQREAVLSCIEKQYHNKVVMSHIGDKKINVKQKRLKLCLAVKKEKDTRSLPIREKKDSEKIDTRRSRFLLV